MDLRLGAPIQFGIWVGKVGVGWGTLRLIFRTSERPDFAPAH